VKKPETKLLSFIVKVWDKELKKYFNVKIVAKDTAQALKRAKKVVKKEKELFNLVEGQNMYAVREIELFKGKMVYPSIFFISKRKK
jgi:hypothetical protein